MPRVWQGKNRHRLKRELPFQSRQNRIQGVSVDIQVVPATAALVLTTFAPIVSTPRLVTPGTGTLVLTTFPPTVATPRVVMPATAALLLSTFAPSVAVPRLVIPGVRALSLTRFAPTVTVSVKPPPPPQATGPGQLGHVVFDTERRQWRPPWSWLLPEKDYDPALLALLATGDITEDEFVALLAAMRLN